MTRRSQFVTSIKAEQKNVFIHLSHLTLFLKFKMEAILSYESEVEEESFNLEILFEEEEELEPPRKRAAKRGPNQEWTQIGCFDSVAEAWDLLSFMASLQGFPFFSSSRKPTEGKHCIVYSYYCPIGVISRQLWIQRKVNFE